MREILYRKVKSVFLSIRDKDVTGFTLVETIIYVGVLGILVSATAQIVLGTVDNYRTAKVKEELASSANDVFGFFFKEAKNAGEIYLAGSSLDADLGALSLISSFQFGDEVGSSGYVDFYLSSDGRILLKRTGETPLAITPSDIEVTKFKFARSAPDSNLEGVSFYLDLKSKSKPSETFSLSTFVMLRGGYKK